MNALFNNREIATGIWLVIAAVFFGRKASVRNALGLVFRSFLKVKIVVPVFLMALYVGMEVLLLYGINLWNISMLKDTIYWFILSGFVLFMNSVRSRENSLFFRKAIIQCFAVTVVIEFLANLYTFPMIGELVLIPALCFLGVASVITENNPEYEMVRKLFDGIQVIIGMVLLGYLARSIYLYHSELIPIAILLSILLPILLTLLFLPFIYFVKLVADYETFFIRLRFIVKKDKVLLAYVRRRILSHCHLNLFRLNRLEQATLPELWYVNNRSEMDQLLEKFRTGLLDES